MLFDYLCTNHGILLFFGLLRSMDKYYSPLSSQKKGQTKYSVVFGYPTRLFFGTYLKVSNGKVQKYLDMNHTSYSHKGIIRKN